MAARRGAGTNQYTKAKKLGLPKPEISKETRQKISDAAIEQNKHMWTEEFRKKHSESMKRAVLENPESYSKNNVSGRVKIIEYKGIKLKGSWELKTAKWLDSQSIKWESEVNPQPYFWNGDWHLYFPDFYLEDFDTYIEVKGYKTERDHAKWDHFKGKLLIVDKNTIHNLNNLVLENLALWCNG